jgi:hypothetical protein
VDPELEGPSLPTKANEEFKPFNRKVPEFKFWEHATRGTVFSLLMTLTKLSDVPVFWPILVFYFLTLLVFTLRDRVSHMIKHRYLPCSFGKKKYAGLPAGGGAKVEGRAVQSAAKPGADQAMFRGNNRAE